MIHLHPKLKLNGRRQVAGGMKAAGVLAMVIGLMAGDGARAQTTNVAPQMLTRYAWCLEQARHVDAVYPGQRGVGYRCLGDTAASYFNELERRGRKQREILVHNEIGAFLLRPITGVGNCWRQVEDELGRPVSAFGCDVFIAY